MHKKALFLYFILITSVYSCDLCRGVSSFANASTTTYLIDDKISKISVSWSFDAAFSSQILKTYDKNKNKQFDESEVKEIYSVLSKFQDPKFMTGILINYKNIKNLNIQNFYCKNINNSVVIGFDIILDYELRDKTIIDIFFIDQQGTLVFLQKPELTKVENFTTYKIKKSNTFKVFQETMSVANVSIIEIKK